VSPARAVGLAVACGILAFGARSAPPTEPAGAKRDEAVFAGTAVRGAVAPETATAIAEDLRRLFGGRGARVVVQAESRTVVARQGADLGAMDARLDDAARALADGDLAGARTDVTDGIALFEEALAFAEDDAAWARYREALLLQAAIGARARDTRAIDDALLQLLAVEPEWQPRRGSLPGDVAARVEFARDDARATPPAPLEVKSRPPNARVLVDGRRAGRAPVAVEVLPGVHYVLVEEDGKVHRERAVVTAAGARVTARLGSPEMEAAAVLVRQLRAPATTKKQLVELAVDIADKTLVAVVVPYGKATQVFIGRMRDEQLDVVVGATVPLAEAARAQALFDLVEAAMTRPADAWITVKNAPSGDAAKLRESLLQGQGDLAAAVVVADASSGPPVSLIVGGVLGGLVIVGGTTAGVLAWLANESEKDRGFRYAIDGSGLE
jgi:hypothetical protein